MTDGDIVAFCRYLRDNGGFGAGVTGTLAAVEAAREAGDSLRFALKTTLCASKDEWDAFDDLFDLFFHGPPNGTQRPARKPLPTGADRLLPMLAGRTPAGTEEAPEEQRTAAGASPAERLRRVDFSQTTADDQAELDRLARRLLRQASFRLSRRLTIAGSPRQVDLRRTIRRSIGFGGDPLALLFKGKKPRQARLVLLLDISGSMSLYSAFLLRFAHALAQRFQHAHTFVFSTGLVDITKALRRRTLPDALALLSRYAAGWSGGTKIGECLRTFNRLHAPGLLSRDTLFLILSDGWDTGEPEALVEELRAIRRRVRRVVWLNPLLGLEEYRPVTRAMSAALPLVDVFAPAHSLESLLELERRLGRGARFSNPGGK